MDEGQEDLTPDTAVAVPSRVRAREVGGEAVLVDLAGGTYYALDEVGTAIWQRLAAGATLGQARDAVVERFEVEPDCAWSDLVDLVRDLLAHALVTVQGAEPGDPSACSRGR